jgi:flavodoxin
LKTLIVPYSKFGNTRRIAESIAETMRAEADVRVVSIDALDASELETADLVVTGSPTHAFAVPQAVRDVLEALPAGILTGTSVAAFDTTVKVWPLRHLRASPKLLRELRKLGGSPVAPPQTFFVRTRNPQKDGQIDLLLDGEIDRARQWAHELLNRSSEGTGKK